MYGDDPNAPTPQGDDLSGVEVPQNSLHVPLHFSLLFSFNQSNKRETFFWQ